MYKSKKKRKKENNITTAKLWEEHKASNETDEFKSLLLQGILMHKSSQGIDEDCKKGHLNLSGETKCNKCEGKGYLVSLDLLGTVECDRCKGKKIVRVPHL